jgi:hypothetical protein
MAYSTMAYSTDEDLRFPHTLSPRTSARISRHRPEVERFYQPLIEIIIMSAKLQVAVLDDYQSLSVPVFGALDSSTYEVTTFKDTLLPYNHPGTPDSTRDALVERLEPFEIICRSCSLFVPKHRPVSATS